MASYLPSLTGEVSAISNKTVEVSEIVNILKGGDCNLPNSIYLLRSPLHPSRDTELVL